MAASALLKNTVSVEEWMVASKETKKHCTLKMLFLRLNTRKHVFMNNYLGSVFPLFH